MRSSFVLVAVLLIAFSLGDGVAGDEMADINEGFKRYLQTVLENLKNNMDTGIPELKIPPLDPLQIDEKVDETVKNAGTIRVDDIRVKGLKTLTLEDIDANLNNLSAEMKINIGRIMGTARYDCDLLLARIFPVKGNGKMHVEFHDVTLRAKIVLKSEDFVMFEVTDIDYEVRIGGSNVNFENIIDPKLAPTINKILSGILPLLTNSVMPKVNHKLTPLLINLINKELTKVKITELIDKMHS